jgi:hypothetical protein
VGGAGWGGAGAGGARVGEEGAEPVGVEVKEQLGGEGGGEEEVGRLLNRRKVRRPRRVGRGRGGRGVGGGGGRGIGAWGGGGGYGAVLCTHEAEDEVLQRGVRGEGTNGPVAVDVIHFNDVIHYNDVKTKFCKEGYGEKGGRHNRNDANGPVAVDVIID